MSPDHERKSVLFLCTGNSCRSQMAEGWTSHLHGENIEAFSAGTDPTNLDPRAKAVMAELGIDITGQASKSLVALAGRRFDMVVTVCDRARERCPVFPGETRVVNKSFPDPPALAATADDEETALAHYRRVRDEIRDFIHDLPALLENHADRETR